MQKQTKSAREIIKNLNLSKSLPKNLENGNEDLPELSDKEIEDLILSARQRKAAEIKKAEYWARVRADKPKPSFNDFMDYCFYRFERLNQKKFIVDHQNEEVFNKLAKYFHGSADISNDGIDPDKGIFIFGGVGTGKTALMKFFADNPQNSFVMAHVTDVAMIFQRGGYDGKEGYQGLNIFSQTDYQVSWSGQFSARPCFGFCFDDLGVEQTPTNHFGNSLNVMAYIIQTRYNNFPFFASKTHITTNLGADPIEKVYGERIRSRMAEMFNLVKLTGDDRRRSK